MSVAATADHMIATTTVTSMRAGDLWSADDLLMMYDNKMRVNVVVIMVMVHAHTVACAIMCVVTTTTASADMCSAAATTAIRGVVKHRCTG